MNVRPTHPGEANKNKKAFYYDFQAGIAIPRNYADGLEHPFFMGGKMNQNWDLYVRDEEDQYVNEYAADLRGQLNSRTMPICFDKCVDGLDEIKLTDFERTCFLKCYLRRNSSLADLTVYYDTKNYHETIRG